MYAITGITGQVGGACAEALLRAGKKVRAVARDTGKAERWRRAGCEVAPAQIEDPAALAKAFSGAEGVFLSLPPVFDPSPGFPESRRAIAAICSALREVRPARVVCLSTIGAQAGQENLLTQLSILEAEVGSAGLPTTFLRPAWFVENAAWDVAGARDRGAIVCQLQPLARKIPMVSARDVGAAAAELLATGLTPPATVELAGPEDVSPDDLAAEMGRALGKEVRAQAMPRAEWEAAFRAAGMTNPGPRMRMLDGFNEGWIGFEGDASRVWRGRTTLREVMGRLAG